MFKLIAKKEFSSAHILNGHPGNCKRMHGHNWLVEAKVEAPAAQPEVATATATASATDDKSKASADDILAMIRARQSK